MTNRLLSPNELAERLNVTAKTVRRWLRDGSIKGTKVGRLWRISEQELTAFLKAGRIMAKNHQ